MDCLRIFERSVYETEEIDVHAFPVIGEIEFACMQTETMWERERAVCYAYYRKCEKGSFIDIYVWDSFLPEGYKRFVLAEGWSLSRTDEEQFLDYFSKDISFEFYTIERMYWNVCEKMEHIHLHPYDDMSHIFFHLYYALSRSSMVKELLYKANLDYLAEGLGKIEDYNLLGSSPQEVFDLPIGLLKALNSPFGVTLLMDEQVRNLAKEIYASYHNWIYGHIISKYEWEYLIEKYEEGGNPKKKMCKFLAGIEGEEEYGRYLRYRKSRERILNYYGELPEIPEKYEMYGLLEICEIIEGLLDEQEILNRYIEKVAKRYRHYTYEDEYMIVQLPMSVKDFLEESAQQKNCLYDYVYRFIREEALVLFMRLKMNPDKSYITLEIEEETIVQAYEKCNGSLWPEQKMMLEHYAKEKDLILEYDWEFD